MQASIEDSWPQLPGPSSNYDSRRKKTLKKFSVVVKECDVNLKIDPRHTTVKLEEIPVTEIRHTNDTGNGQPTLDKVSVKFEKELREENRALNEKQTKKRTEVENVFPTSVPRNYRKKVASEEKKRAKEEEIRKNLVAPKGQKVRVVDRKMLEVLLNNSVSFVSRENVIPTLTEEDFPSMEEASKQRVKSNNSSSEHQNKHSPVMKRIKKHKDPVLIDLVKLIKKKPKRLPKSATRVQKREKFVPYSGNELDASKPQLKRGKMREFPKKKKPSSLKCAILEARALRQRLKAITSAFDNLTIENKSDIFHNPIHSRKFREYCDNSLTSRLNEAVKLLLKDIVRFQDRQHDRNPVKAFAKRRYISGFREVRKKLNVKKVKLIIIAPDLEVAKNKGGIDETVTELKAAAKEQNVLCAYALSRRELGYLTFKKVGISCIGICNYEGSETNYNEVVAALAEAQEKYQLQVSSRSGNKSDVTNEVITSLLSKLSQNESPFLSAIEQITDSDNEREVVADQQDKAAEG